MITVVSTRMLILLRTLLLIQVLIRKLTIKLTAGLSLVKKIRIIDLEAAYRISRMMI